MKKFFLVLSGLIWWLGAAAQEKFEIIHGPYLQQLGENAATIMWVTNRDAVSWVELLPDDGTDFYSTAVRPRFYQSEGGRRVTGKVHAVRIEGLDPGAAYRYRVYSKEVTRKEDYYMEYGRTDATEAYHRKLESFRTFDNTKEKTLRFTVVNDIHEQNDLLTDLLGNASEEKPRFVVFNGDMCHTMRTQEQIFESFMDRSVELFASDIPVVYTRGNHETRGVFSYEFLDYFPSPTGKAYYAFRCGPAFFLVLDGAEDKPDGDMEYYELGDYDRYREEEARWLEQVVESPGFKEASYRIVFLHLPPVEHEWHGPLQVRRLFVPILNRAGIDVMFCGHTHRHLFVPAGERECAFPVLINAAEEVLDVNVDERRIGVNVRDRSRKIVKTFEFPHKP